MAAATDGSVRAPSGPGILQGAVAVAMSVLLALFALTVRQQPPPTIAELAPQAQQQVKESPKELSSETGDGGDGDCLGGSNCQLSDSGGPGGDGGPGTTTTTASIPRSGQPPIDKASVKRCVGDPPRQIEDPQSPPCVAFFDGDNGGATHRGVTADTIRVAIPTGYNAALVDPMVRFFNDRFQFYGRKLELVPVTVDINGDRAAQRAGAEEAYEKRAFASTSAYLAPGYNDGLFDRKIISTYWTADYSDTLLAQRSPYLWGYPMSATQQMERLADYACTRLVDKPATHAGNKDRQSMKGAKRVFAMILQVPDRQSDLEDTALVEKIRSCGGDVPIRLKLFRFTSQRDYVSITDEIRKMKDAGVTTVFSFAEPNITEEFQNSADSQLYEPEWVYTSFPQFPYSGYYSSKNQEQSSRAFGVNFQSMERLPSDMPSVWAVNEGGGGAPSDSSWTSIQTPGYAIIYHDLLLLASGIQMAGPRLTPETFGAGLRRTKFPNPPHPIMAGAVGFDDGDHSMMNDGAEMWWLPEGRLYADSTGAWCYVDGGARHARGRWPTEDRLFDRSRCEVGTRTVS